MTIPSQNPHVPAAFDRNWNLYLRIIAVAIGKGGVGKTTLAAILADLMHLAGLGKVLLMDFNNQANQCEEYDLSAGGRREDGSLVLDDGGRNLVTSIIAGTPLQPIEVPGRPGLYLSVGGPMIATLTGYLSQLKDGKDETLIAEALALVAHEYAAIIIDSPPENPAIQKAVLGAARYLIIPTKTDVSSWEKGIGAVAKEYIKIKTSTNPNLELLGAVVTFTDELESGSTFAQTRSDIQAVIGDAGPVLERSVPHLESVAKLSRRYGLPVTALERRAVEEGWPKTELQKIMKISGAWAAVATLLLQRLQECEASAAAAVTAQVTA